MNCSSDKVRRGKYTQNCRFGTNRKHANVSEEEDMQEKKNQKKGIKLLAAVKQTHKIHYCYNYAI